MNQCLEKRIIFHLFLQRMNFRLSDESTDSYVWELSKIFCTELASDRHMFCVCVRLLVWVWTTRTRRLPLLACTISALGWPAYATVLSFLPESWWSESRALFRSCTPGTFQIDTLSHLLRLDRYLWWNQCFPFVLFLGKELATDIIFSLSLSLNHITGAFFPILQCVSLI